MHCIILAVQGSAIIIILHNCLASVSCLMSVPCLTSVYCVLFNECIAILIVLLLFYTTQLVSVLFYRSTIVPALVETLSFSCHTNMSYQYTNISYQYTNMSYQYTNISYQHTNMLYKNTNMSYQNTNFLCCLCYLVGLYLK